MLKKNEKNLILILEENSLDILFWENSLQLEMGFL